MRERIIDYFVTVTIKAVTLSEVEGLDVEYERRFASFSMTPAVPRQPVRRRV